MSCPGIPRLALVGVVVSLRVAGPEQAEEFTRSEARVVVPVVEFELEQAAEVGPVVAVMPLVDDDWAKS